MTDGALIFDTGIDNSGFSSGISNLQMIANTALGNIAASIASGIANAAAQIPAQIYQSGSGFEAQLSTVQAIAMADSEQMDILKQKASEMGASTAFSATEAGKAMEYMAMAGWDTEQMVSGIDGIMSLAAASGEDLATTSDILTDALTAFGLSAKDSAGFADILAAASSKSNTNVSMLGESFKYVAPLFGSMSYSAEDAAVALGLMANAGIKGSMAGTSLKTAIANLISPTNEMSKTMDQYGISIKNADGTNKDFMSIMGNLRTSFKGLDDAEKASAVSTIFGKEAMSGMLAIINASDDDFNNLTGSIYNCEGAAEQMSEVRLDNLQGDVTILKSGIDGLKNSIYDGVSAPLRDAAKQATEYISKLSDAFTEGGFEGLAEAAGDVLAQAVTYIFDNLTGITDTAVKVVDAFVNGLVENSDQIMSAAGKIIETLVMGVADMLPDIAELALNIILSLADSLSTSLPELIPSVVGICLEIADILIENIDTIVEAAAQICIGLADGLIDSLPLIIEKLPEFIEGIVYGLIKSADKITLAAVELVAKLSMALLSTDWGNLGKNIIIAIGKGFVNGIEEAINPGKAAIKKQIEDTTNQLDEVRKKGQENIEQTNKEAYALAQKADTYETLRNKVNRTVEEEEQLKKTAEDLQAVLPDNISLIDEQTGAYNALGTSIADVIENMRKQAILASKQDEFDTLSVSIYENEKKLDELNKEYEEQKERFLADKESPNSTYRELLIDYDPKLKGATDEVLSKAFQQIYLEAYNAGASLDSTVGEYVDAVYSNDLDSIKDGIGLTDLENAQQEYKDELKQLEDEITNINKPDQKKSNTELLIESERNKQEKQDELNKAALEELKNQKKSSDSNTDEYENELSSGVSDAFKEAYDKLETDRLYSIISDEEYYAKLQELLDKNNAYGVSAYNSYYKEIFDQQKSSQDKRLESSKECQKKELSNIKSSLSDIVSTYKKQYNDILSEQDNYKSNIKSELDLFSKDETDDKITYTMENLKQYKNAVAQYTSSISKLKEKGLNDDILGQIQSKGIEDGSQFASMLLKKSDAEIAELNDTYSQINNIIDKSGKDIYGDKLEQVNSGFVSEVKNLMGTLPPELQNVGLESATAWVNGLDLATNDVITQSESIFDDVINSISDAIDAGTLSSEVATNFVDGFISELETNSNKISTAIDNAFSYDDISTNVKATVESEVTATSNKLASGGTYSTAQSDYSSRQNANSNDIAGLLSGINKPLNVYLEKDKLGYAMINFINANSRQTGRTVIK